MISSFAGRFPEQAAESARTGDRALSPDFVRSRRDAPMAVRTGTG